MISNILLPLTDLILGLVEALISLRIILKLFGASTTAPFVRWVYETTAPLLQPFMGMFPSPKIDGGFVIEFSALFALVIYAFVGYLLTIVFHELTHVTRISKK